MKKETVIKEEIITKEAVAEKPLPKKAALAEVEAFLEERLVDGGATTDQLQTMLSKLKPDEYTASPVVPE